MSLVTSLTYVLPHRLLSSMARSLAYSQNPRISRWLIDTVSSKFNVNLAEAANPDPRSYPSFNAFFTRALKPGARVAAADPRTLTMPADGRISQLGRIRDGRIFQAKGQEYTAAELLGSAEAAEPFRNGSFATIYLSPRDYHRVHMPLDGELTGTTHVPGRIFSVAPFAVEAIPRLFARNERLVCHFDGEHGPFVSVMVGAILVSSVATVWDGLAIPPYASDIIRTDCRSRGLKLERFAEMARFNMGSTVILLLPAGYEFENLQPQQQVIVGQKIGKWAGPG